jgi:transcriptional regulator with XRE-family HTH domain
MTETEIQQLARLIEHARQTKGFSYGELAARAGVDKSWLHRLENKKVASPDPVLLTRVTEALGIDPARIDRVSNDHLASSMPGLRTYFRSKEKLPLAALQEIEDEIDRIRAKHKRPSDERSSDDRAARTR